MRNAYAIMTKIFQWEKVIPHYRLQELNQELSGESSSGVQPCDLVPPRLSVTTRLHRTTQMSGSF